MSSSSTIYKDGFATRCSTLPFLVVFTASYYYESIKTPIIKGPIPCDHDRPFVTSKSAGNHPLQINSKSGFSSHFVPLNWISF